MKELWFLLLICLIIIIKKLDKHFGNILMKYKVLLLMHKKKYKEDHQFDKTMDKNQILDFYFIMDF